MPRGVRPRRAKTATAADRRKVRSLRLANPAPIPGGRADGERCGDGLTR